MEHFLFGASPLTFEEGTMRIAGVEEKKLTHSMIEWLLWAAKGVDPFPPLAVCLGCTEEVPLAPNGTVLTSTELGLQVINHV